MDEGLVFDAEDFKSAGPEVRGMAEMYLHEIANTHARELSTWLSTQDRWSEEWSRTGDAELVQKMHDLIDVPPFELRARVGWTLVEVGLRLAAAPKPVVA
ncbi:hypothetical protein ABZ865_28205 [Streptomyces sp. NPDC047085]|uniref:hypothetical protein n=1 Tax=Streptomyces sp. NPDC047085 TaxID=3155140 RepID=UPI0034016DD2